MNQELIAKLKQLVAAGSLTDEEFKTLTAGSKPPEADKPADEETPEPATDQEDAAEAPKEPAPAEQEPESEPAEEAKPEESAPPAAEKPNEAGPEAAPAPVPPAEDKTAVLDGRIADLEGTMDALSARLDTLQGLIDKLAVPAPAADNSGVGLPAGASQQEQKPSQLSQIKKQLGF